MRQVARAASNRKTVIIEDFLIYHGRNRRRENKFLEYATRKFQAVILQLISGGARIYMANYELDDSRS